MMKMKAKHGEGDPQLPLLPHHGPYISLRWLSDTLAINDHTDVNTGTPGPGLGHEGDSCVGPGPPWGMCCVF